MECKYTYEVIKCNGLPLHFVYIQSPWSTGVKVFSQKTDMSEELYWLKEYDYEYDYNLSIPNSIVEYYKKAEHLFSKIENRQVYCG